MARRSAPVAQILQFIQPTDSPVFDEFATRVMGEAFDAACKVTDPTGQPEEAVQYVIARRIIDATRNGERDVTRLKDMALLGLIERPSVVHE
jgi:hypothetical protein